MTLILRPATSERRLGRVRDRRAQRLASLERVTSYRTTMGVTFLRPGTEPEAVLPAAARAARARTTVEASDVAVVRGAARITVRFTAEDDCAAVEVARGVHAAVVALAGVASPDLARRYGPRWRPVGWSPRA